MRNLKLFFVIISLGTSLAQATEQKVVYVDGIYDIGHFGHARSFEKARTFGSKHLAVAPEKIKLIVGICDNDGNLKAYKRDPVFDLEMRVKQVQSFKGVDEVIANAPMAVTAEFIKEHNIDLVMHGDDFDLTKVEKYYGEASKQGKFATFPYEPGVSTSDIIKRATLGRLRELAERKDLSPEECDAVLKSIEILERHRA